MMRVELEMECSCYCVSDTGYLGGFLGYDMKEPEKT